MSKAQQSVMDWGRRAGLEALEEEAALCLTLPRQWPGNVWQSVSPTWGWCDCDHCNVSLSVSTVSPHNWDSQLASSSGSLLQTDHASDWSTQITWPGYWPLIGLLQKDLVTGSSHLCHAIQPRPPHQSILINMQPKAITRLPSCKWFCSGKVITRIDVSAGCLAWSVWSSLSFDVLLLFVWEERAGGEKVVWQMFRTTTNNNNRNNNSTRLFAEGH